jgi:hypothetical protein
MTTPRTLHVATLPKPWSEMTEAERFAWATAVHEAFVEAEQPER